MAYKLTLEEINEYKAAFTLFDKDSDGKITSEDMVLLMRSLGRNFSNKVFKGITDEIDRKGNGIVELHEFLNLMANNRVEEDEDNLQLIKSLKYFDLENVGTADFDEFKHVLTTVAEKLSPEETEALERLACPDSNGRFNYKELAQLMLLK